MQLRSRIRRRLRSPAQAGLAFGRGFQEQLIVADQRDDLAIEIQREFAEHLAEREPRAQARLVADEMDGVDA